MGYLSHSSSSHLQLTPDVRSILMKCFFWYIAFFANIIATLVRALLHVCLSYHEAQNLKHSRRVLRSFKVDICYFLNNE